MMPRVCTHIGSTCATGYMGQEGAERGERDARRARPRRWMWGGMCEEGRWRRIAIPTVWVFKGGT